MRYGGVLVVKKFGFLLVNVGEKWWVNLNFKVLDNNF